ncbi:hypothetical protein HZS_1965 [Henneguya salminicola]|nr:hypothetical protein HZS_1965 [Henneguya salminicola]
MGVRGLTTVILQSNIGKIINIENCNVVIDCYSLIHFLYLNNELDRYFGGQSFSIHKALEQFMDCMSQYNVKAFVICDGQFDVKKKEATKLYRMANILNSKDQEHPEVKFSIEFYYAKIFSEICKKYHQVFLVTKGEADRTIATLAHYLGAFILSNDSDFYIYNTKPGYISLSTIRKESNYPYSGTLVSSSDVVNFFSIKEDRLGLFAAMCGNDLINTYQFDKKFRAIYKENTNIPRVTRIAKFINSFNHERTAIEEFRKFCEPEKSINFNSLVEHISRSYNLKTVFGETTPEKEINKLLNNMSEVKSGSFVYSYSTKDEQKRTIDYFFLLGLVSPSEICSTYSGVNYLTLPVQNCERDSVHDISVKIRLAIYKLASIPGEFQANIVECDREATEYKRKNWHCLRLMNETERQEASSNAISYILNELSITSMPIGSYNFYDDPRLNLDWSFVVIVLYYITQNTKENYPDIILESFLLSLIKNVFYSSTGEDKITIAVDKNQLPKYGPYLLHYIGHYTSVITHLETLNTLLNSPICPFPLKYWFDGPTTVETFIQMSQNESNYLTNQLNKMKISLEKFKSFFSLCFQR